MATADERAEAFRGWIRAIMDKHHIGPTEFALRAGLSHSTLSRVFNPNFDINFRLSTIEKLARAGGISPPPQLGDIAQPEGLSEPDAAVYEGPGDRATGPNQSLWTVKTDAMKATGMMPGDHFILEQGLAPRAGDCILVQVVDYQTGTAETLLRMFADGFAVTPLYLVDGSKRLWIDNDRVAVAGVVVESWRTRLS